MSTTDDGIDLQKARTIRALNDAFRTSFIGGRVVMTSGVNSLPEHLKIAAIQYVRGFSKFNADNDPWHEHDFGSFEVKDERLCWKISYYDKTMEFGSEDPSNPAQTTRVLTIMLANEY
jgi:hypothetical protein